MKLTDREMEVAQLLAWGFSDKEVAHQLNISFDTVRCHHQHIYQKTNSRNLSDVTRWYFAETGNYQFGIKPALRAFLAGLFMVLTINIELHHLDAMRARVSKVKGIRISQLRVKRKSNKNYQLC